MIFGKLLLGHELRYMRRRANPPLPEIQKFYYPKPKISVQVQMEPDEKTLMNPTETKGFPGRFIKVWEDRDYYNR